MLPRQRRTTTDRASRFIVVGAAEARRGGDGMERLGVVLGVVGAGIAASVVVVLRQLQATLDRLSAIAKASHDQLELGQQSRLAERYTRAVDQLDAQRAVAVRLGGL